jgi:short-subunit dehydrogenase
MKLNNKVVVITGAGSGMGRELALQAAKLGSKVAAVDFREDSLSETVNLCRNAGGTIEAFKLDVTDTAAVAKLPADVAAKLGPADALINNAGIIQPFVKVAELSFNDAERVMKVNFDGPLHLIKAFLPDFLKRPEAHILNVASMGAYAPVPGQSVYGASKAAIKLLTEGLRSELLDSNVGVTLVFPGAIATNIAANSGMTMSADDAGSSRFKTTPANVAAQAMLTAIEKNQPRICIGQDAKMMDFLSRLNPVMAANIIYKQMKSLLN